MLIWKIQEVFQFLDYLRELWNSHELQNIKKWHKNEPQCQHNIRLLLDIIQSNLDYSNITLPSYAILLTRVKALLRSNMTSYLLKVPYCAHLNVDEPDIIFDRSELMENTNDGGIYGMCIEGELLGTYSSQRGILNLLNIQFTNISIDLRILKYF